MSRTTLSEIIRAYTAEEALEDSYDDFAKAARYRQALAYVNAMLRTIQQEAADPARVKALAADARKTIAEVTASTTRRAATGG